MKSIGTIAIGKAKAAQFTPQCASKLCCQPQEALASPESPDLDLGSLAWVLGECEGSCGTRGCHELALEL